MATDVIMPQMGESVAEGTITKWLIQIGEAVERDQPLFEISTDKVDAEIPSPASGILLEVKFEEGSLVQINDVVAVIGESGEQPTAAAPVAAVEPPAPAPGEARRSLGVSAGSDNGAHGRACLREDPGSGRERPGGTSSTVLQSPRQTNGGGDRGGSGRGRRVGNPRPGHQT